LQLLLGLAVLFWLAGFDVIYSLQDGDFDRKQWLYSIPVRFGVAGALCLSGFFHVVTVIFLALVHLSAHMGVIYWVSFSAVAAVLFGSTASSRGTIRRGSIVCSSTTKPT
jgi:4-hydroxybenzoate polyprenyltransferase